jgi:ribose transport system permease protein
MKSKLWLRIFSDYGMILVLLALGVIFTAVTWEDQFPRGEAAARQLAGDIRQQFGKGVRVMIAARNDPEDAEFAERLTREVEISGGVVAATVSGEAVEARESLRKLGLGGGKLDVVAASAAAAGWPIFTTLGTDFPSLGKIVLLSPHGYRWPGFLKADNLLTLLNRFAIIGLVAAAMTAVVIAGGIDLSVGSLIGFASVLCAVLIRDHAGGPQATVPGVAYACIGTVLICGAIGAFSGLAITLGRLPPYIVTLAVALVAAGSAAQLMQGRAISELPNSFVGFGGGADIFGIPNPVVFLVLIYAPAQLLMARMKVGRYLYAIGGNSEAARLAGVPVKRIVLATYVASAMLAGLAGLVVTSQLKSGSATHGETDAICVIAAVLIGGTSLRGGEGGMLFTLIGVAIVAVLQNGLSLCGVESSTQKVALGLVILAALLLDRLRQRLAETAWRRKKS